MNIKRILAATMISMLLISNCNIAFAIDDNYVEDMDSFIEDSVEDLGVQLNDLYKRVGEELNIDYIYVKMIHLVAGGKAVYADQRPNIYSENTVDTFKGPFEIEGVKQDYNNKASWAFCPDSEIVRPSKYYLPDAAYNVTADIVKLMNKRYYCDRGYMQDYFDALDKDIKTTIIFYEAMLDYVGADDSVVNRIYRVYEQILYEKNRDENVLESDGEGKYHFKERFEKILTANNIDEQSINVLSVILSFDSKLAAYNDPDSFKNEYINPYKINYTSRENMMIAAMSVVGKVRYVWGGGHLGTGNMDGINPAWKAFYDTYLDDEEDFDGAYMCIKPTASWCPIHGRVEKENGCLIESETVFSVEQYVESRKEIMDTSNMRLDKYKEYLESKLDIERGVVSHRLDGLDCSGYSSWVFNQINDKRTYDSGARAFISSSGLNVIDYYDTMLPGDVFSWGSHIVVIVGKAADSGQSYIMLEASPNTVKFGVLYRTGVSVAELEKTILLAKEANDLIGALNIEEKTHIYNMDNVGYREDGERYAEIGRLQFPFIDENTRVVNYNETIKNMLAKDIIQHTIDNLPYQYISGINSYEGDIFKISIPEIEVKNNKKIESDDTVDELVGIN